jgi:hypothetical protein
MRLVSYICDYGKNYNLRFCIDFNVCESNLNVIHKGNLVMDRGGLLHRVQLFARSSAI